MFGLYHVAGGSEEARGCAGGGALGAAGASVDAKVNRPLWPYK